MTFTAGQKVRASQLNDLIKGRINSAFVATNGPSGVTTTETVLDYLTGSLTAGRRYAFKWDGDFVGGTADSTWGWKVRYLAGAALVVAGSTKVRGRTYLGLSFGNHEPFEIEGEFTAPTTAQYAVGVTLVRLLGTGTGSVIGGTDNERFLSLRDITNL
ncbi:hypothetical protein [Amycolatopsis sp. cmx-4-68]|uniref:hypothetical protein n=1 Tax=Amycolatopsis sp. cmx-4-68 TaxID=2790938 RepID=UPI0039783E34